MAEAIQDDSVANRMGDDRYDMQFQGLVDDEQFTADGTFVRKSKE